MALKSSTCGKCSCVSPDAFGHLSSKERQGAYNITCTYRELSITIRIYVVNPKLVANSLIQLRHGSPRSAVVSYRTPPDGFTKVYAHAQFRYVVPLSPTVNPGWCPKLFGLELSSVMYRILFLYLNS